MAARADLVLASGSPRRRELLERVGLTLEVVAADIDESVRAGEEPVAYARRLAGEKAIMVAAMRPESFVLAADTIVELDGEVLGKPADASDARAMLAALLGREHRVTTAVCVLAPGGESGATAVTTEVSMRRANGSELDGYLACGEWRGKAGGYAIQGVAAALIERVSGSVTNVVGLPLLEALALVASLGGPRVDLSRGRPA